MLRLQSALVFSRRFYVRVPLLPWHQSSQWPKIMSMPAALVGSFQLAVIQWAVAPGTHSNMKAHGHILGLIDPLCHFSPGRRWSIPASFSLSWSAMNGFRTNPRAPIWTASMTLAWQPSLLIMSTGMFFH